MKLYLDLGYGAELSSFQLQCLRVGAPWSVRVLVVDAEGRIVASDDRFYEREEGMERAEELARKLAPESTEAVSLWEPLIEVV